MGVPSCTRGKPTEGPTLKFQVGVPPWAPPTRTSARCSARDGESPLQHTEGAGRSLGDDHAGGLQQETALSLALATTGPLCISRVRPCTPPPLLGGPQDVVGASGAGAVPASGLLRCGRPSPKGTELPSSVSPACPAWLLVCIQNSHVDVPRDVAPALLACRTAEGDNGVAGAVGASWAFWLPLETSMNVPENGKLGPRLRGEFHNGRPNAAPPLRGSRPLHLPRGAWSLDTGRRHTTVQDGTISTSACLPGAPASPAWTQRGSRLRWVISPPHTWLRASCSPVHPSVLPGEQGEHARRARTGPA